MDIFKNYMLVSGTGTSVHKLVSFDKALYSSGIQNYNLVRVSSILPCGCTERFEIPLAGGSVLFSAIATVTSDKSGRISSAVGIGLPKDRSQPGVIMECSVYDTLDAAEAMVKEMVEESMALRKTDIDVIKWKGATVEAVDSLYSTAFAAVVMW